MRNRISAFAALLCVLQAGSALGQGASADRDAIMAVQTQIETASATHDAAAYVRLTTPDFIRVAGGRFIPKDEWIRENVAKGAPGKPALNEEPNLKILGSVAVLVVKNTGQRPGPNGQPPATTRLSRVFVKSGGTWRAALTTASPLTQNAVTPAPATRPATAPQNEWTPQQNEVLATLKAINAAASGAKPDAFSAVTADDFIAVGATGTLLTKADRMKAIAGSTPSAAGQTSPAFIHVYGDAAVAGWTNPGGGLTVKALAKQNGRWVQLLNHNAPGAPAAPAR
jgi:hypothetical protein